MNKKMLFFLVLSIAMLAFACSDDEPDITSIKGTITIDNTDTWATWVDSGEMQITIFPAFSLDPPAGWGDIADGFFGPNVPGGRFAIGAPYNSQNPVILEYVSGQSTYDYEIEVEPGSYSALALGFRHDFITDATLRTATLGVNWDTPNTVSHGVQIRVDVGGGNIVPVLDFPAPTEITVVSGEQKVINFRADFDFVKSWYR